ncbi:DUF3151 domain-containing protein [Propionibacteriaceae bacterium G1746]|uniref:DUF3151 domain-containing protein n=1 Tax=Aestuariimicrobium sp. G57 TaxID=3418485 RepID=UPI003C2AA058
MAGPETHPNLMASAGIPTRLPDDPAVDALIERGRADFYAVVREYPASSLCWAILAEGSLMTGTEAADIAAYAYARTGYHRGLDALRRAGWKGSGPIPWDHEPNQGFLRCLWALTLASERIGDVDEADRCAQFLRDSSEEAYQELSQDDLRREHADGE